MDIRGSIETSIEHEVLRLFADFGEKLYNFAFLMCRNAVDAEDLVLRTFENAAKSFSQYDRTRPAFPWLCAILMNCYRMDLRGKGRNALDFMSEPPEVEDVRPDPAETLVRMADAKAVHEAVARLPERYRALIVLRYFDDQTVPQIAAATGIAEGSVKRMLHEAKEILRGKLAQATERIAAKAHNQE